MKNKISLFLDSGAYSAWSQNINISLQEYIDFIHEYKEYIDVYANLDDLTDAKKTWKNQEEMERQGLFPLPVYHLGDDKKYLQRVLKYEYFALGGMALVTTSVRIRFYDFIFAMICQKSNDYFPIHKIHGFGMTSLRLMLRYPWYSVDSTSWVLTGRFGSVYVPKIKSKGEYVYDENSWKICVSNKSPSQKEAGRHITTFSEIEREEIKKYFKIKGYELGKSEFKIEKKDYELKENEKWFSKVKKDGTREVEKIIELGLCNDYKKRDELNIIYFLDLEKSMPKWPWAFKIKKRGFGISK